MRLTDPDGMEAEDEWEVKKNEDGSTTTTKTGTKDGDITDHITYKDAEGNTTGKEMVSVEHTETSNAAIISNVSVERGPGYSHVNGFAPNAIETTSSPIDAIIFGSTKASVSLIKSLYSLVDDLFGTVPKGPGAKGSKGKMSERQEDVQHGNQGNGKLKGKKKKIHQKRRPGDMGERKRQKRGWKQYLSLIHI